MGTRIGASLTMALLLAGGCGDPDAPPAPVRPPGADSSTPEAIDDEFCDGVCDPTDSEVCASDCAEEPGTDPESNPDAYCGDDLCVVSRGEDAATCPEDCVHWCGDHVCTASEDSLNCWSDCGAVCGDGVCNGTDSVTCPSECSNPEALATIRIVALGLVQYFSDGTNPIDVEVDPQFDASSPFNDRGFSTSLVEVSGENNSFDDSYHIPLGSDGGLRIWNTVKLGGRIPMNTIECDLLLRDAVEPTGFRPELIVGAANSVEVPPKNALDEIRYSILCATNNWEEGTEAGIQLVYEIEY